MEQVQSLVVGAGVVGLAIARELAIELDLTPEVVETAETAVSTTSARRWCPRSC